MLEHEMFICGNNPVRKKPRERSRHEKGLYVGKMIFGQKIFIYVDHT